jgi:hypothetical protein
MAVRTLRAHFDGERVQMDELCEIEPDAKLLVTILPKDDDEERGDWLLLSAAGLARAYSEDEVEYPLSAIKEKNPEYEGR